jgi:hypothetical protein
MQKAGILTGAGTDGPCLLVVLIAIRPFDFIHRRGTFLYDSSFETIDELNGACHPVARWRPCSALRMTSRAPYSFHAARNGWRCGALPISHTPSNWRADVDRSRQGQRQRC